MCGTPIFQGEGALGRTFVSTLMQEELASVLPTSKHVETWSTARAAAICDCRGKRRSLRSPGRCQGKGVREEAPRHQPALVGRSPCLYPCFWLHANTRGRSELRGERHACPESTVDVLLLLLLLS